MAERANDSPGVHRLSDMLVEEVSLVDRAANRRKFLLVKRAPMALGTQVTARQDGSYTATGGGGAAPAPNAAPPAPIPDAAPRAKASVALTDDAKAALLDVLDATASMLADAADLVKGAKKVDPDPASGEAMEAQPLLDLVGEALGELEDCIYATFGIDEDAPANDPAEGVAPGAPPGPGPVTANAPPLAKRLEVARAKRVLAKAEAAKVGRDFIAKYGVRMKKERLARFQTALDTLVSIAGEVMAANLGKGARKPSPPPPPPPAAGARAPAAKAGAEGNAGAPDVAAHPAFLLLQRQLKSATEQLARLEKNVQPSNAAPLDGGAGRAAGGDTSWPLDMNDDRYKDRNDPNFFGR